MNTDFWIRRWESGDITGFHEKAANPLLVKYFTKLSLPKGGRVFLPLCGKSLDIQWLLSKGYRVAGAELSELAVTQLFAGLGLKPDITDAGLIKHYRAKDIDIFLGDIFKLFGEALGRVDAVYDRAALVALPKEMRDRYTAHLMQISNNAKQLLICYEYDQKSMEGPPFSITSEEVDRHYRDNYRLSLVESADVPGGLKGKCAAKEKVWLLYPLL